MNEIFRILLCLFIVDELVGNKHGGELNHDVLIDSEVENEHAGQFLTEDRSLTVYNMKPPRLTIHWEKRLRIEKALVEAMKNYPVRTWTLVLLGWIIE